MKRLFQNWDWEDSVNSALLLTIVLGIAILFRTITADHKINYYYVSGSYKGIYSIGADINWATDIEVDLPNSVTFEQAIKLVEEMNVNLLYDGD